MAKSGSDGRPASSVRRAHHGESAAGTLATRGRMQAQRTRDTAPEMAVRRLLHGAGLRYRVDRAPLPGLRRRADLVFGPARVVVYVDGCFWHGCDTHRPPSKTNPEFWERKIATNRARDEDTDDRLRAAGWLVVRAWEHELPEDVAAEIEAAVRSRRPGVTPPRAS